MWIAYSLRIDLSVKLRQLGKKILFKLHQCFSY